MAKMWRKGEPDPEPTLASLTRLSFAAGCLSSAELSLAASGFDTVLIVKENNLNTSVAMAATLMIRKQRNAVLARP